jgi:hypothetical protein
MAQQSEIDTLKAENERLMGFKAEAESLMKECVCFCNKNIALKEENSRLKAQNEKYKTREANIANLVEVVICDKDEMRQHMVCEGWTKGKTEEQIAEMVESAFDYANDNIQSLIAMDDTFNTVMDDWWEEADEFNPKAE